MTHHFFPSQTFAVGLVVNTEELTCLLEYLWFSFKRSQDALVYSYLEEVQHHPPLEGGMIRRTELHPKIQPKGTGKIQMRLFCIIMFEIGFSRVVCPLKLEALLEYFSRMLQPRVDVYRPAGRACRHRHRNVFWPTLRSICPAGPYCVNRSM